MGTGMRFDPTVAYYFLLITIYILLPLIPAIIIFRLFPNTTVAVSGPLQNFTINATGAFAAYVVTILLGVFLFRNAETAINYTRKYPVEGLIVGLKATQAVDSYRFYSHSYSNSNDPSQSHDLHFVVLFDQPIDKPQTVEVDHYESGGAGSGVGQIPGKVETSIQLLLR